MISSFPITSQGESSTVDSSYSGEYYIVRYHLNAPDDVDDNYNDTSISTEYVDVVYYGSIVSTEYNPQLWADTVVTNSEINWNWLEIKQYSIDNTYVFTGWMFSDTATDTHYPGEVLSDPSAMVDSNEGVIHIYASWDKIDNLAYVAKITRNNRNYTGSVTYDGNTYYGSIASAINSFSGGNEYTNIVLCYSGSSSFRITEWGQRTSYGLTDAIDVNGATAANPSTIRASDPSTGTLTSSNIAYLTLGSGQTFNLGANTIIDRIGFNFTTAANHGQAGGGIYANGNVLVIGTGIMSFYSGNGASPRENYPQLISGGTGNIAKDHDIEVYPADDSVTVSAALIIHSGTWANITGGSRNSTITGSTYTVVKKATILDTYNGGGSNNSGSTVITGSAYSYFVNAKLPGDYWDEYAMDSTTPTRVSAGSSDIEWPFLLDTEGDKVEITESTILTGGGNSTGSGSYINGDTYVFISGQSVVWDAQAGGRSRQSVVYGTGHIELSGMAISSHILCGATTDGISSNNQCVKKTDVTVKDSAKAATVCGAGYDTWASPVGASMYGEGSSISVNILGGTVRNVYGGGFRAIVGLESEMLGSISITVKDANILGDVYGGGSGGLDKVIHSSNGSLNSANYPSHHTGYRDTTGKSYVYAKTVSISIEDSNIEGSVYGGGKSVPAISSYNEKNGYNNGSDIQDEVAKMTCDALTITISGDTFIGYDVFGGGRGISLSSSTAVSGANDSANTEYTQIPVVTPDGTSTYIPWFEKDGNTTGGTDLTNAPDFEFDNSTAAQNKYENFASVTSDSIEINIDENVHIGSCVYGASARSPATSDTSVIIKGSTSIDGSVYGGGLMGKLTGNTNVDVSGSATITTNVFGGADIGDRSSTDTDRNLVTGTAYVHVDGTDGASIGKNIIGSGNSCLVAGDKTILIENYKPTHTMNSIQDATLATMIDSEITLTGKSSSESSDPSNLMSLYGMDDLRLINTKLSLYATMDEIKKYGSYSSTDTISSSLSEASTIYLSSGLMFNTGYDRDDTGYETYGPISGYTILDRDLTGGYGAFAYGQCDSSGKFYTTSGTEIAYIDRLSSSTHDAYWLWILMGSEKRTEAIIAEGDGTSSVGTTSTYVDLVTIGDLENERLALWSASLDMVYGASMMENSSVDVNQYCFTMGSSADGCVSFNNGNGFVIHEDMVATSSTIDNYVASGISAMPRINFDLAYNNAQTLTGLIGTVYLEFIEEKLVGEDYVPICSISVEISIYCIQDADTFGGDYTVMMYIESGSGDATFSIPAGFTGLDMEFVGFTVNGRSDLSDCITIATVTNSDGNSGWQGATGMNSGTLTECVGNLYRLSGGFIATLAFEGNNILDTDLSSTLTLSFSIIKNPAVNFNVTIKFDTVELPTIKGIVQNHGTDVYCAVTQNSTGTYSVQISGLTEGVATVTMNGFNEATCTSSWDEGVLSVGIDTESRGTVPVFVTIYRSDSSVSTDLTAEWFRVVFFIVGPLEDATI